MQNSLSHINSREFHNLKERIRSFKLK